MVLFDRNYAIKKYYDEIEILEEFYSYRYDMYGKRKENLVKKLN